MLSKLIFCLGILGCALAAIADTELPPPQTAEDSPPVAAASEPAPPPEPVFDCEAAQLQASSALERGQKFAAARNWAEAVSTMKKGRLGLNEVASHCPDAAAAANALHEKSEAEFARVSAALDHQQNCQPRLDRALEVDIQASAARKENRDSAEQEALFAKAETAWRDAAGACQSPFREKAEKGLAAVIKARAANAEQLSSGPACDTAWKNAGAVVSLAQEAWKMKRWEDATNLYENAILAWERVQEDCTGSRQQLAAKKIVQLQTDAFNAGHCGPQWDFATEQTQTMKANAAASSVAERELASIKAEVAWRDALLVCQGMPRTVALNNAEALARERGAPLTPKAIETHSRKAMLSATLVKPAETVPPKPADKAPATKAEAVAAAKAPAEKPAGQAASSSVSKPLATGAAAVAAPVSAAATLAAPTATGATATAAAASALKASTAVTATAATAAAKPEVTTPPKAVEPRELVAGNTTYRGNFDLDKEGLVSGEGTVIWASGDRFTGRLLKGQRQGRGRFVWAAGNSYDGDWKDDAAIGRGMISFVGGNRYEGQVVNGRPEGEGTLSFASGDRYVGQFNQGQFSGQGKYLWKSGDSYSGAWKDGRKEGDGRMQRADGVIWEGKFSADKPTEDGHFVTIPAAQP